MIIRPYVESDEDAVVALWRAVFPCPSPWNDPRRDLRRKLAVQRELFFDGHRGWVYYVGVAPAYRRRGIGAALMRRVEEALQAVGCGKLNLQVRAGNDGAVAFYRGLGFKVEERVSMGKRLDADAA
jgi:ribosomal protein S18 acetylase RimI-like enzyme